MNELVVFVVEPSLTRNSLIFTGLTLRTFSAVVSECFAPLAWFVHCALPTRSPLNADVPAVTLNVALTLAPGATGPAIVADALLLPAATAVHCLGAVRLNCTPTAGAAEAFVNVKVVSCDDPGAN